MKIEMITDEQRKTLNADEAREILDYEPSTGILRWKRNMNTRARSGMEAGVIQQGKYRRIGISGRYYMAHRLAWLIVTGKWPTHEIDHINGIKSDNRICNLREATPQQNKRNTYHRNNTGLIGASYSAVNGKYRAQIRVDGERKFLGWFVNAEDANKAYVDAARKYHGEFAKC